MKRRKGRCRLQSVGARVSDLVSGPSRVMGGGRVPGWRGPGDPHRRSWHRRVAGGRAPSIPPLANLCVARPVGLGVRCRRADRRLGSSAHLVQDPRLHLSRPCARSGPRTCRRSSRPSSTAMNRCRDTLREVIGRYPIVLTRDLARAKRWIRERARGSERYGLVASSQAMRLKPHAIDVRVRSIRSTGSSGNRQTRARATTWRTQQPSSKCRDWSSTGPA